jgi:3-oxoacyl-[acyl-carrier-protein] synthase III
MGAWKVASPAEAGESMHPQEKDFVIDFLSEAEKHLETGRHQSAAILAGDALEDTLRKLCAANCVVLSAKASAEIMNAELGSRGIYDDEMQQRLHRAATLSDKANCGLWSDFSKDDVELMLAEVRAFAAEHASA